MPTPQEDGGWYLGQAPCGVEIKTTFKNNIVIDYHQEPELRRRLLCLWELNLFQDLFSESGRRAVYNALFRLLSYIDQLNADNNPPELSKINLGVLGNIQKHWNRDYIGPSCESLRDNIREYEVISKHNKQYSKLLFLFQSSGTGKSRLADEYGKFCPMVTYVLRNDHSGFPPRDNIILDTLSGVARESYSKLLDQTGQSPERMQFCEDVRTLACQIASTFMKDKGFHHCFSYTETLNIQNALSKCRAIQDLHTAIGNLEKRLGDYAHKPNDPLFTLVFDEVHRLISRTGQDGPVIALNRVISIISNHRIFFLFLSTESILNQIFPQDDASRDEPSLLDNAQDNSIMFPPFTEFAVDITDFDVSGGGFFQDPRQECMADFGKTMHMAKFGPPTLGAL